MANQKNTQNKFAPEMISGAVMDAGGDNSGKKTKNKPKLAMLVQYLEEIGENKFTGYIKINFSQGSVGRIEKFEEILKS